MNRKSSVLYAMPERRRTGKRWIKPAVALLLLAIIGFWFLHPPIFSWMMKGYIGWKCQQSGLVGSAGKVHARIGHPIRIENFQALGNAPSETRIAARRISISVASPWEIFFGDGRIVDHLTVEGMEGTFDLRANLGTEASSAQKSHPETFRLRMPFRLLPKDINGRFLDFQFLTADRTYQIRGVNVGLSESEPGALSIREISVTGKEVHQSFEPGKGVTAWKNGALYLADFALTDSFRIENFTADLLRAEGLALGFDIRAFGGYVRGDLSFGVGNGLPSPSIDGALTITQLGLEKVPKFLGVNATMSGLVREGRLTFHGNPRDILKTQASLRIAADKVRWNKRGWDTLILSANLVDGKIFIPEFSLRQAENHVNLNGEMKFPARFTIAEIKKVDYSVSGTADIKDLSSLAVLFGEHFQFTGGQLTLKTAVKGRGSNVTGNLSLQATSLLYRGAPAELAVVEVEFVQKEAHITRLELRNRNDSLSAHAGISLHAPHSYWGDMALKVDDLMPYVRPFLPKNNAQAYRGKVDAFWQGDGTLGSHSGVFDVKTTGLTTPWALAGLGGEFKGSYSPDNLYFSKVLLRRNALTLSLQATLAKSGMHFQNILFNRQQEKLLEGAVFAPLDAVKLFRGASWIDAIIPSAQIYSRLSSRKMPLRELAEIFGQPWQIAGTLTSTINASGPVDSPRIDAALDGYQCAVNVPPYVFPPSDVSLLLIVADGKASLRQTITAKGTQPARLTASMPFQPKTNEKGGFQLFDPNSPVMATLEFPKTSPAILQPLFPDLQKISGTLSGRIDIQKTLSAPQIAGHAELANVSLEVSSDIPRIDKLSALVAFESDQVVLRRFSGMVSGGPFEAAGKMNFKDRANILYQLQIRGKKILLSTDSSFRLRADIDLTANGGSKEGIIRGDIRVAESRVSKRLQVTPLLAPSPARQETEILPAFFDKAPFSRWALDISIQNDTPLHMDNGKGEITPKLHLGGTLGYPLPEGEILLKDIHAYFPAGVFRIPEGRIYFNISSPRIAMLDLRGMAETGNYKIYAQALGSLKQQKLSVRSDPPLNQQAMFLLLTKGITPASTATSLTAGPQNPRPPLAAPSFSLPQNGAPPSDTEMIYNFRFVEEPASRSN